MAIKLSTTTASMIYLTYVASASIDEYMQGILQDPEESFYLKDWAKTVQNKARFLTSAIATKVPAERREYFREQLKNADPLRFDAVKDLMIRMSPRQQELMEELARSVVNGEIYLPEKSVEYDRADKI